MLAAESLPTLATLIESISEHCPTAPGGCDVDGVALPYHSILHLHHGHFDRHTWNAVHAAEGMLHACMEPLQHLCPSIRCSACSNPGERT